MQETFNALKGVINDPTFQLSVDNGDVKVIKLQTKQAWVSLVAFKKRLRVFSQEKRAERAAQRKNKKQKEIPAETPE